MTVSDEVVTFALLQVVEANETVVPIQAFEVQVEYGRIVLRQLDTFAVYFESAGQRRLEERGALLGYGGVDGERNAIVARAD